MSCRMGEALERTYAGTPEPKRVVAIGDCTLNWGCFAENYAIVGGVSRVIRVGPRIPGCPPSPLDDILKGLLALIQSANLRSGVI
jgi:Ni,Fe-hydrogenase III small subunit